MIDSTVRGANGGNARAAKLTKEQRSAIAKQAAAKRWATPKIYMEEPRFIPVSYTHLDVYKRQAQGIEAARKGRVHHALLPPLGASRTKQRYC